MKEMTMTKNLEAENAELKRIIADQQRQIEELRSAVAALLDHTPRAATDVFKIRTKGEHIV